MNGLAGRAQEDRGLDRPGLEHDRCRRPRRRRRLPDGLIDPPAAPDGDRRYAGQIPEHDGLRITRSPFGQRLQGDERDRFLDELAVEQGRSCVWPRFAKR